jgi:signal transduction histidine kinase/DNA-binding response OmpR family regulator
MRINRKPATVVVVNDDRTQLNLLAGLLRKGDVEGSTFENAEAALAAMDPAHPPDLIITDLYMPGIDGWRFCRLLRSPEYAAFNEVPILVVSATFAGDHPERIAADVRADAFLPSPVDGRAFMTLTRALLAGKETRPLPRVLIVEDSRTLAGLLKKTYTAHGFRADTAFTVREAREAFASKPYDTAILDYHLPDGKGDTLLDPFHDKQPSCVCLMMTTDPTPELALSWMKQGAAAYLRKPFDPALLMELCARARRERALLRTEDLLEARTKELLKSNQRYRDLFIESCDREDQLREKESFQNLLMTMATQMVNIPLEDVEDQINGMLQEIGRFTGLDRIYIFMNDYHRNISINTHEWCAKGIHPQIDDLQAVPLDQLTDIIQIHRQGKPFSVPRVSDLPVNDSVRRIIEPQGIRSLLLIPLIFHDEYIGYVGFDAVRQEIDFTETELNLLKVFAELIVNIEMKQKTETEREKLHDQLLQAQKLESVGRLAGGVAHDFNNMLGVIIGHVEFALDKAETHQDVRANLKEIQTAARRSADIIKQLLTFARRQTITPRHLDLNDSVENLLTMLRRLIGEDIDLDWQPGDALWPVKMDPTQVHQILANLCVNARDAISGMGRLTIQTRLQTFDEEDCSDHPDWIPGEFVCLAVTDNGCGMEKDTLDNLFEPFFTTKEVGKGTGLGLATIYGIVKQNHGFIDVDSAPGQGTTFSIYLPRLIEAHDPFVAVPEKKAASGGTETILLVEDEPIVLEMTTTMLDMLGYMVLTASSPGEALRQAREHTGPIHLLMTDVVMPEMNGRDLAEKITALYPGIRRLFMSGYTANVIAHQGVLDDGVAFIQKPFAMADMAVKLREVLA